MLQVFRIQMVCSGSNVKLVEQGTNANAKILASRAEVYAKVRIVVCYKWSGS